MALQITDPTDWKLDPTTGDLIVPVVLVRGVEAVAQALRIGWRLVRGEWTFDIDAGVPYIENDVVDERTALLARPFDAARWRAELRKVTIATTGVASIDEFTVDFDGRTREVAIRAVVLTTFGERTAVTDRIPT